MSEALSFVASSSLGLFIVFSGKFSLSLLDGEGFHLLVCAFDSKDVGLLVFTVDRLPSYMISYELCMLCDFMCRPKFLPILV